MVQPYAKKKYSLDAVAWTPITAPFDCNSITLRNQSATIDVKLRTDQSDSDTEDTLPPGNQEVIQADLGPRYLQHGGFQARYATGAVICYAQAASSTADLLATFIS